MKDGSEPDLRKSAGRWLVALAATVIAFAVPAVAEDEAPPRPLSGADEAREWQAVGRLDLAKSGFCTGVLISDRHVLTAAHCLYSAATGRAYEPDQIVFNAGLRNGSAIATRRARRFAVQPGYLFGDDDEIRRIATDVAVIELEQPIRDGAVIPFATGPAGNGDTVTVVSYAAGRDDTPALQEDCRRLGLRDGVGAYSCDAAFGASGSPIFVRSAEGPRIASVISAMARWNDRPVSLGPALGTSVEALLTELAAALPVARTVAAPAEKRSSIAAQLGREQDARASLPQIGFGSAKSADTGS